MILIILVTLYMFQSIKYAIIFLLYLFHISIGVKSIYWYRNKCKIYKQYEMSLSYQWSPLSYRMLFSIIFNRIRFECVDQDLSRIAIKIGLKVVFVIFFFFYIFSFCWCCCCRCSWSLIRVSVFQPKEG